MTEAPLTSLFTGFDLGHLPSTTLACEQGVQVTTKSALVSYDHDSQDGSSFNKISAKQRNTDTERKTWKL